MSGTWFIVRTAEEWAQQIRDAIEAIKAANGGIDPPNLRASAAVDPGAFSLMIEGLVALGVPVDDELIQRAGLVPVDEVLW